MRAALPANPGIKSSRASDSGLWAYAPLLAALAMRLASAPTANLSYLVIAAYALLGPAHAIRGLALSWFFMMINPGIAPDSSAASVGRYAVLFAAAISAMIHNFLLSRRPQFRPFTLATILLGVFLVIHSLLFSSIIDVSVLKAVSWTLAMTTLVSAWSGLPEWQRHEVSQQIFLGLMIVLVFSLPLVLTSLGYLRNGSGFQGVLSHPQAFGPAMALLGAWAASRMIGERRPSWWLVGLTGVCIFLIFLSEARTAGLAMVGGVALSLFLAPGFAGISIMRIAPGLCSVRLWTVLGMSLIGSLVMAPKVTETVGHYVTKSGRSSGSSLTELYEQSRGGLMDTMLDNIAEKPLTGIGFGIASEPALMEVTRSPVLGLPTGASIEKGVAPLMVWEEVGVFGALLIAFWLVRLLRSAARSGFAPFAISLTVLLLNMGEATFFSAGGFGLLPMILLGWAFASSRSRVPTRHG